MHEPGSSETVRERLATLLGPGEPLPPDDAPEARSDDSPADEDPADVPAWTTPEEAAFLVGVPPQEVIRWAEDDQVERMTLLAGEPAEVLVRTRDVIARAHGDRPQLERVFEQPARARIRGPIALVIGAAVVAGSVLWLTRDRSDVETPTAPASVVAPSAAPGAVTNPTPAVSATPTAIPTPPGETTGQVVVGASNFVATDRSVSAYAKIRNPWGRWVPPSDVTFQVLDATGAVIALGNGLVELPPGAVKVVGIADLSLGPEAPEVADVRVIVRGAPSKPVQAMPGEVRVLGVRFEPDGGATLVTGTVHNTGERRPFVRVDCALFGDDGSLAGVAVGSAGPLANGGDDGFRLRVDRVVPASRVVCSAS
jgi:hypothetical protein